MKTAACGAALALAACAHPPAPMDVPGSLAAAETAFAAHSVREDMRAAFMAAFDADGVFVRNGWTVAADHLRNQPAPPIVLDWKPVHVEVAAAGDLGLSTGPWKITRKAKPGAPPAYGQFVSVWRREGNGTWKVAVDLGIGHPEPSLWQAPLVAVAIPASGGTATALAAVEADFAARARAAGLAAAHREYAARDLRFYRNGAAPMIGRAAALAAPSMAEGRFEWIVERAEAARSGDLGYARGRYALPEAPTVAVGYYLRVWRREAGSWRVALDIINPAPPRP